MGRILAITIITSLLAIAFLGACAPFLATEPSPTTYNSPRPDTASPVGNPPVVNFSGGFGFSCQNLQVNVTFAVHATASEGVATVILYYILVGTSTWQSQAMDLVKGEYLATIGVFAYGDNLSYYANATDTQGNFTCSPVGAPVNYYTTRIVCLGGPPPATEIIILTICLFAGLVALVVIYLRREVRRELLGS